MVYTSTSFSLTMHMFRSYDGSYVRKLPLRLHTWNVRRSASHIHLTPSAGLLSPGLTITFASHLLYHFSEWLDFDPRSRESHRRITDLKRRIQNQPHRKNHFGKNNCKCGCQRIKRSIRNSRNHRDRIRHRNGRDVFEWTETLQKNAGLALTLLYVCHVRPTTLSQCVQPCLQCRTGRKGRGTLFFYAFTTRTASLVFQKENSCSVCCRAAWTWTSWIVLSSHVTVGLLALKVLCSHKLKHKKPLPENYLIIV